MNGPPKTGCTDNDCDEIIHEDHFFRILDKRAFFAATPYKRGNCSCLIEEEGGDVT